MLSATAGGSGFLHDSSPQQPGARVAAAAGRLTTPKPLAWLGPTEPAAQHSGEWRLLPSPRPPLGTGWPGSFVQRARGGPAPPPRAPVRSAGPRGCGARGAIGLCFHRGPRLGWARLEAWQAAPGRGRGRWTRRGGEEGGVLGFPGRPAAPPARGRGARPALPGAPSFPLPPSLDLKLQFAFQLAENGGETKGGTVGAENKAGF